MGAVLLLNVTTIMTQLAITIKKCILFCDAILTLIIFNNHPSIYAHPMAKWLATTNLQLYKVANMIGYAKENIHLFILKKHVNFADLLTKFYLEN